MERFSVGSGKYQVKADVILLDEGINITLYGGEYSHIGSVVVAIPRPSLADANLRSVTSSVLNLVGHKDDEIAKPVAEKIAKTLNQVVVVTAGVHIEGATSEDIAAIIANTGKLITEIIAKLNPLIKRN